MKIKFLLMSGLFLVSSSLFPGDVTGAKTDNSSSSLLTAASVTQGEQEFETKCVSVSDPTITCGGAEAQSTLKTAETTAKTAAIAAFAGTAGGSSAVSTGGSLGELAGVAIACAQIKCDASDSTKSTTNTTCISGCVEDPPLMVNYDKCTAGCPSAYGSDTTRDCNRQVTDTSGSTQPYSTGIQTYKASAKTLQTQCRSLCKAVANQSASFWMQATAVAGALSGLQDTIKGGGSTTSTPSNPNITTTPTKPTTTTQSTTPTNSGTGDPCSGKTGDALAQCSCTSLGGTWSDKTRCSEASATSSNSSLSTSASGTGTNDATGSNSAKGTGSSSASSSSSDITGDSANGKKMGESTASSLSGTKNGSTNSTGSAYGLAPNSSAEGDKDAAMNNGVYPDIAGKDEKIFEIISKIYSNKYNEKEIGSFALKSDKKNKVTRTRSHKQ
ncbi:MAG: hypothetical protein WCQ47_01580 [bacterium]